MTKPLTIKIVSKSNVEAYKHQFCFLVDPKQYVKSSGFKGYLAHFLSANPNEIKKKSTPKKSSLFLKFLSCSNIKNCYIFSKESFSYIFSKETLLYISENGSLHFLSSSPKIKILHPEKTSSYFGKSNFLTLRLKIICISGNGTLQFSV